MTEETEFSDPKTESLLADSDKQIKKGKLRQLVLGGLFLAGLATTGFKAVKHVAAIKQRDMHHETYKGALDSNEEARKKFDLALHDLRVLLDLDLLYSEKKDDFVAAEQRLDSAYRRITETTNAVITSEEVYNRANDDIEKTKKENIPYYLATAAALIAYAVSKAKNTEHEQDRWDIKLSGKCPNDEAGAFNALYPHQRAGIRNILNLLINKKSEGDFLYREAEFKEVFGGEFVAEVKRIMADDDFNDEYFLTGQSAILLRLAAENKPLIDVIHFALKRQVGLA